MSAPGLVDLTAWLLRTRVLCTAVCCCSTLCLQLALSPTNPDCVWPVCGLLLLPVVLAIPAALFYIQNVRFGLYKTRKKYKTKRSTSSHKKYKNSIYQNMLKHKTKKKTSLAMHYIFWLMARPGRPGFKHAEIK